MKQKDIIIIIAIVVIAGALSFVLSSVLFSTKQNKQQVEVVEPISAEFNLPDKKYFNENSVNPTQLIKIGDTPNPTPFNKTR
jgi:hypothetical protein